MVSHSAPCSICISIFVIDISTSPPRPAARCNRRATSRAAAALGCRVGLVWFGSLMAVVVSCCGLIGIGGRRPPHETLVFMLPPASAPSLSRSLVLQLCTDVANSRTAGARPLTSRSGALERLCSEACWQKRRGAPSAGGAKSGSEGAARGDYGEGPSGGT